MDLDSTLCYCFHIKKRKIVNFVKQTRPRRASQITECFGAGTGCGWCIPFLERIHRRIVAGEIVESDDISPAEYEAMRAAYREEVRIGARAPNTLASVSPPPAVEARPGPPETPLACGPCERSDDAPGWDVSDYFSRPRPGDAEPDTIYPETND